VALPDLAVAADLSARGVDVSDTALVATMLAVASSVVRGAAQSPIAETTSTVTLWATEYSQWLTLPGKPVTAVASVEVDGVAQVAGTDYKLVHGDLWAPFYWGNDVEPVEVVVEMTHGFAEVPPYIVQLVCDLAIAGMTSSSAGAHDPRVIAEKIDDYAVTFAEGAEAVATAMELPRLTLNGIRARFGGGAGMVSQR
jgi:hypothetical protein